MSDDRIAGWVAALALMGALIVAAGPGRRRPAWAAAALLALYLIALALSQELLDGGAWSPAIAAVAVWLVIQPLIATGRITRAQIGFAPLRAGSARPAAIVAALVLIVNAIVMLARGAPPMAPDGAAVAVTIAALVEELVMRGAVLAFADRATPPRWNIAGAPIGLGGLLVTAAFVALHGLRPGLSLGVLPAALLYLWLRARTDSLAAPIIAHVLWNLSVVLLHR